MKGVVISDLHADVSTLGIYRFDEAERAMRLAYTHAIEIEADFFLFLGDLTDPDSGGNTFRAIDLLADVALHLEEKSITSIFVAGNHDVINDGTGATCLTPLRSLDNAETKIHIVEVPTLVKLDYQYKMMVLPYVPLVRHYSPAEFAKNFWPSDGKVIVASHLMIPGIIPGEETTELPRGRDIPYPLEETKKAVLRLSGHYHTRQIFEPEIGPPIHVVGTPMQLTFGDVHHQPAFLEISLP